MPEPRIDAHWQAQGETLEDLGRLHDAQPWQPQGLPLSRSAFAAFASAGGGRLRGPRVKDADAVRELTAAGLVDGSGRLTPDGETTHTVLRSADRRVRVESVAGGVPGTYEAARLQGTVVVWATDSPQRSAGDPATGREALATATSGTLMWFPTMQLAGDLAGWLQVGPSWPMAVTPVSLTEELVTARSDDPTVPPPADADDNLRAVWAAPWFTWTLGTDTEHQLAGIHAGRHGHLRLVAEGDRLQLHPWPAETLFSMLVGVSLL